MKLRSRMLTAALLMAVSLQALALENIIRMEAPIAHAKAAQPENPEPPPGVEFSFASSVLPAGRFGDTYSADLNTLIANYPVGKQLSWQAALVPSGLVLSDAGILSGEPMSVGSQTVEVVATDGKVSKNKVLTLEVASNAGTYSMFAGTGSGSGINGALQAVGSYKTDLYGVSMGNIIRDDSGNRIMAYMHKIGSTCYANVANTTGDGYASTGSASSTSKTWIQNHPTLVFNTNEGIFATYSGVSVQTYYNGWYKTWVISCSVFSTWYDNPGLVQSVTFR